MCLSEEFASLARRQARLSGAWAMRATTQSRWQCGHHDVGGIHVRSRRPAHGRPRPTRAVPPCARSLVRRSRGRTTPEAADLHPRAPSPGSATTRRSAVSTRRCTSGSGCEAPWARQHLDARLTISGRPLSMAKRGSSTPWHLAMLQEQQPAYHSLGQRFREATSGQRPTLALSVPDEVFRGTATPSGCPTRWGAHTLGPNHFVQTKDHRRADTRGLVEGIE